MKQAAIRTVVAATLLLVAGGVLAQTGGSYDLEWSALGSAGSTFVTGGSYQLGFILAQDAPPLISAGGSYQLAQGFWQSDNPNPTAVTLAGFWVEARGEALVVCWETASEVDLLGFNLHRSDSGEPDSFGQLNQGLIPGQVPGSAVGASYEWMDLEAEAGHIYFYALEAVDVHGQGTQHGPVEGSLPPGTQYFYYLPLVPKGP